MRAASGYNRYRSAEQRRQEKAARRSVLVQCNKCGAKATGTVNARRQLVSTNLNADVDRFTHGYGWRHRPCGGRLEAFDIEVV